MQAPNIPTDNLYKFIALSGVAIFLATLLYSGQFWLVWRGHWTEGVAELRAAVEAAKQGDTAASNEARVTAERHLGRAELLDSARPWVYVLFLVGLTLGASVAVVGFYLWYHRVQVFQDAMLLSDAARITGEEKARR